MNPSPILTAMVLATVLAAGSLAEVSAGVKTPQSPATGNSSQPSPQEVDGDLIHLGSVLQQIRAVEGEIKANTTKRATLENDKAALVKEAEQFDQDRNRVAARWPQNTPMPIDEVQRGNQEIERINKWRERIVEKVQVLNSRFLANDQEATNLKQRSEQLNSELRKVEGLLSHIPAFAECLTQSTFEAAHQCMQSKWDEARSSYSMDPMVVKPAWRATPLTAEEAIERYKRSGNANPGANTIKTKPVPPPTK